MTLRYHKHHDAAVQYTSNWLLVPVESVAVCNYVVVVVDILYSTIRWNEQHHHSYFCHYLDIFSSPSSVKSIFNSKAERGNDVDAAAYDVRLEL